MENEKVLTISIAAYNVEKYLDNTLNSLICNKMDKLEVIIQNDGSKDSTCEVAKKYVEKYPNVFILNDKKNGGYGSTINASLKMAKGKYFKQLDGDDWFDTSNLDSFIELLCNIDSDCVSTACTRYYEDELEKNNVIVSRLKEGNYDLADVFVPKNDISKMHMLTYKTSLLKKINFKMLEHCFYTDQEYILYPLMSAKTMYISHLNIYMYRLGREGQSVSKEGIKKHYKEHLKVIYTILSHTKKLNKCDEKTKKYITHHIKVLISNQYMQFLMLPYTTDVQNEVMEFDKYLKEYYPNFYKMPLLSNKIVINKLRKNHFNNLKTLSEKY